MERQIKDQHSDEWESGSVYTNFYFKHVFEDGELRLITDSIISSKHIPDHQRKDLINKVEQLSSKYWEGQVFGIGAKIFTIAGPVILYGIFTSWVLGVIYWVTTMF